MTIGTVKTVKTLFFRHILRLNNYCNVNKTEILKFIPDRSSNSYLRDEKASLILGYLLLGLSSASLWQRSADKLWNQSILVYGRVTVYSAHRRGMLRRDERFRRVLRSQWGGIRLEETREVVEFELSG